MATHKTDSPKCEWVWDDNTHCIIDAHLEVVLLAKNVSVGAGMFAVCVGVRNDGRFYWWATSSTAIVKVMYTGVGRFDRWFGEGSDDWQRAANDAEWSLRALGFRQEKA